MGKATKTVHLLTQDRDLLAAVRSAASKLKGVEVVHSLEAAGVAEGTDLLLIDVRLGGPNAYEACRSLTGRTRCRTFVLVEPESDLSEAIAHFCGATGTLPRPLGAAELRHALEEGKPVRELPEDHRGAKSSHMLPEALLRDLTGEVNTSLIEVLTDPETNLFNYAFLNYKIDEEFKRAQRFKHPLACLMLGFEGQASEDVLKELSGIFLQASRDTDILGRFDENSFLFLLPDTGPDGAVVVARRVSEMAEKRGLRDIVGDFLRISVGISFHPHPEVMRREDLFSRAREQFLAARRSGTGITA